MRRKLRRWTRAVEHPSGIAGQSRSWPWFWASGTLGFGAWGYMTSQALAASESNLAASQAEANHLHGQVATLQTSVTDGKQRETALNARVASQTSCISALKTKAASLDQIASRQIEQFNLLAQGSVFVAAKNDRDTALAAALQDYYEGFSAAWDRRLATANNWIDKGNTEYKRATAALATMNAEVAKVDRLTNEIAGMIAAAGAIDLAACGGGATGAT